MPERLINAKDATLCAEDFGSPSDPPLIFVMGAASSMLGWLTPLLEAIAAAGRYVIRFDNRDTGRSTTYPHGTTPYDLGDMADDIIAVADGYGLDSVHVVGISLGGLLAQIAALKHPSRVRSLTLISSQIFGPPGFDEPPMSEAMMQHFIGAHTLDWTMEAVAVDYALRTARLLSGSGRELDEEEVRAVAAEDFRRAADPKAALNHQGLAGGEAWYGRTAEIGVPMLVIHGDEDPIIPIAHGEALRDTVAGTRLVRLAGAGHELHRSDWPVIIAAILAHTAT